MTHAWLTLTELDGSVVADPTEQQLTDAIDIVYDKNRLAAKEAEGDEFASVSLKFGYDDGLMYEIEIIHGGTLRFEEWSDQDYEIELAPPRIMLAVSKSHALELWRWLAHRQIARIRKEPWVSLDRHREKEWMIHMNPHRWSDVKV